MAFQTKLWATCSLALLSLWQVATAQNNDFDLNSQRKEVQNILKVPGKKNNHHGLVINPTPQYINIDTAQTIDVTRGVVLKDKTKDKRYKLTEDLTFLPLQKHGICLSIAYVKRLKDVPHVEGAYTLSINKKGVHIAALDSRGVFYAIKTLQQLMESTACQGGKTLPYLQIADYPTFAYRGVVEGFYGTPWSHKVRLSLIDFYGKYKMNTYIYGPKDDAYHSSPNWRKPYPAEQQKQITELVKACQRNRVDFVWAIHPGKDIRWNEEDYHNLVHKFDLMYQLGVRSFAIFFDDISGEGTNPMKQVELLNRLTREFVKQKGDVSPLIVCPTDYTKLWANPSEKGALSIYGKALDTSIKVFWTGDVVCSDVTRSTLNWVNKRIQRPAFFWWNYAVTDYVRYIVLQGPVYGLDTSLTSKEMCGLVSNPMEHGEASKLSLYSVADYTWNAKAYNAMDSWERGLQVMAPHSYEAYRTFAIHSADTETGYRRDESWETDTFRFDNYTPNQFKKLYDEFAAIEQVPEKMLKAQDNPELLKELKPWLIEFGKLGTRGKRTLDLMQMFKQGKDADFWHAYVHNLMSNADRQLYANHRSGTMKLQPFYEEGMKDLCNAFYRKVAHKDAFVYRAMGSYPNLQSTLSRLMFDNDTTSYYTSTVAQQTGEWIGVDLGKVMPVHEVHILQGRNSVDDVDYYDHAILECSADGKTWQPLIEDMKKVYDVRWKGADVPARYVRIRKLASAKHNWTSIRLFSVNPLHTSLLDFALQAGKQTGEALMAFDNQPTTSFFLEGTLAFGVKKGTHQYTFLMKLPSTTDSKVVISQYDKRGKLLGRQVVTTDFYQLTVLPKATQVKVEGRAEVFEVI